MFDYTPDQLEEKIEQGDPVDVAKLVSHVNTVMKDATCFPITITTYGCYKGSSVKRVVAELNKAGFDAHHCHNYEDEWIEIRKRASSPPSH